MGRGNENAVAASQVSMRQEDGEIALLADEGVGSIDEVTESDVVITRGDTGYGDDFDSQSISNIARSLRRTANFKNAPEDSVLDAAETLFGKCVAAVESGASGDQLVKIAEMFGVSSDELAERFAA